MMRTATNVTSQILVPTLVARENGLIEKASPLLTKPSAAVSAAEI